MKIKKIISTMLIIVIFITQFSWINFIMPSTVYAVDSEVSSTNIATKYFYNQLTADAKVFYDTIEDMYKTGDLQKGNISREITKISGLEEKLNNFATGSQDLLNIMGAAKDAFVCDNPNIFYVDFDYLTIRVTQSEGKKHLYLGTGRSDNYINKEFLNPDNSINTEKINASIEKVEAKIDEIVKKAESKKDTLLPGQDLIEQQVKLVHNEIIKMSKYTYEYQTEHPYTIRTTYGAFGLDEGNIVCEGFSRALKTVLDRLGIPCILVRGIYRVTETQPEEHMWNYVQLDDDKWYAVDTTFDNKDDIINDEDISTEFFLVGADKMYKHVTTGILSASNFEFSYPELETVSDKFDVIYNQGPLKVELDDESANDEDNTSTALVRISYNGHGYQKAVEEDGMYILVNMYQEGRDGVTRSSGWSYPRPDIYGNSGMHDTDQYIELMIAHINYLQVGITDIAPAPKQDSNNPDDIVKQTQYQETETSLIYKTDIMQNPNGIYIAPPYVKKANPIVSSVQYIGKTYPVTIEYDDILIPDNSGEEPSVHIMILDPLTATYRDATEAITVGGQSNPRLKYKITDFQFDGQSTFTFNFTPSEMWADDTVYYIFEFRGLMGSRSHKAPLSTIYSCSHECSAYAYTAQGFNFNVYGKPVLMDDDIDMTQMGLDDANDAKIKELSDILKHRLTLVTTKTTKAEDESMKNTLNAEYKENNEEREIKSTETYNINLTLCKKQQKDLKDGMGVRVMLGFPQGYGPEDEGVTFKAYHYIKNNQGEIIDVEEIPCTITKLGLIIEVYSFSPFTIAAVTETEADKEKAKDTKTIILNSTEGGKIIDTSNQTNAKTINTLKNNETENTKSFKIIADDGYEIDEIAIGDKTINKDDFKENPGEYNLNVNYNDSELKEESTMLKVAFVAKSVLEQETQKGETVVTQPVINTPVLSLSAKAYQEVKNSTSDENAVKSEIQNLHPGDKFEVAFSISEISNLGGSEKGIKAINGTLNYDENILELEEPAQNGTSNNWQYTYNSSEKNFNAKTLDDKLISTSGDEILSIKFKVKDNLDMSINPNKTATISLENIKAEMGEENSNIAISDITKTVIISKLIEETLTLKESANLQHITMKENSNIISLPTNTTFKQLHELLNFSQAPKYHTTTEGDINLGTAHTSVLVENVDDKISTGDTITVGTKIWTCAVKGDIDGDGSITINDVAKSKLHLVGKEILAGAYLEALQTDNDDKVTVNDISRIKLVFIKKMVDFFSDLAD